MILFTSVAATTAAQTLPFTPNLGPKLRPHQVVFDGTFAGATAALEMRRAGQTPWISLADDTLSSEPSAYLITLLAGDEIRVAITGATGSTSINCRIA